MLQHFLHDAHRLRLTPTGHVTGFIEFWLVATLACMFHTASSVDLLPSYRTYRHFARHLVALPRRSRYRLLQAHTISETERKYANLPDPCHPCTITEQSRAGCSYDRTGTASLAMYVHSWMASSSHHSQLDVMARKCPCSRATDASPTATATVVPPASRVPSPLVRLPLRLVAGCDPAVLAFIFKVEALVLRAAAGDISYSLHWNMLSGVPLQLIPSPSRWNLQKAFPNFSSSGLASLCLSRLVAKLYLLYL